MNNQDKLSEQFKMAKVEMKHLNELLMLNQGDSPQIAKNQQMVVVKSVPSAASDARAVPPEAQTRPKSIGRDSAANVQDHQARPSQAREK